MSSSPLEDGSHINHAGQRTAFRRGWLAAEGGRPRSENPYAKPKEGSRRVAVHYLRRWHEGYDLRLAGVRAGPE